MKRTSSITVVKNVLYILRAAFTDYFKFIASQEMHISQELTFFGSPLSVTRHNSSALFYLKLFILWTKRAHQNSNFRNCDCSHEN